MKIEVGNKQGKKISLYLLVLAGYIIFSIFNSSVIRFGQLMTVYNIFAIVINFYIIFRRKRYKKKVLRRIVILMTVFCVSAYFANNLAMVAFTCFIFAAVDDFRSIVKCILISEIIGVMIVVLLALMHIITDYTYIHEGMVAHSCGFYYYSAVPFYVFFCILMYTYLRGERLKLLETLALEAIQLGIYKVFTLRLTYYLGTVLIIVMFVFTKAAILDLNKRWIRALSCMLFPMAEIFTVIACKYLYTPGDVFWTSFNSLISNRISQAYFAFQNYPVTLLGQRIEMQGRASIALGLYSGSYFYIDSGYIYCLLVYGLIFTVVILLVYSFIMDSVCKHNDKGLYIWLIAILVFSFMNNALINIAYGPVLLGFMTILLNNEKKLRGKHNV